MTAHQSNSNFRLDDIDRRILYALMQDARNKSATTIAQRVNVSGTTVRNRINNLEENGIIQGYTAQIDFERAGGKLANLFLCNAPIAEREALAHEVRAIPGVINIRKLMTGRRNLHVLAVGEDTKDLQRIARTLSKLGIEIEDENLLENEFFDPYTPFDPDDAVQLAQPNDFISLTGDANIIKVTVREDAPIAGHSIEHAATTGILDEETLIIAIERDDQELTPHGNTTVQPDDIVTVLSRNGTEDNVLSVFFGPSANEVGR